jgi:hypothetical protein
MLPPTPVQMQMQSYEEIRDDIGRAILKACAVCSCRYIYAVRSEKKAAVREYRPCNAMGKVYELCILM